MNQTRQTIVNASAHELPLPDGLFHACVTSPPYYSLRRYAGEQEVEWPGMEYTPMPGMPAVEVEPMRAALGLEPTPEAYIGHLVLCFREVRRVLRDDGVVWVVMGDSYAAQPGQRKDTDKAGPKQNTNAGAVACPSRHSDELQAGDLMLIPHRLALALQGDGWIVRNDVVWAKVAPMPESVSGWRWERCKVKTAKGKIHRAGQGGGGLALRDSFHLSDGAHYAEWTDCPGCPKCESTGGHVLRRGSWRHTRAHETVIMAVKGMGYFADQERVREAAVVDTLEKAISRAGKDGEGYEQWEDAAGFRGRGGLSRDTKGFNPAGRNPRSVLTPRPSSYSGAHYAVFPPDLIAPLVRASVPTKCCPVCGAAWAAVVEVTTGGPQRKTAKIDGHGSHGLGYYGSAGQAWQDWKDANPNQVIGHRPTCDHDADPIPGLCLDNFAGTFTTGAVCAELGVNCVGVDVSAVYLDDHAKPRIGLTPSGAVEELPLFAGLGTDKDSTGHK